MLRFTSSLRLGWGRNNRRHSAKATSCICLVRGHHYDRAHLDGIINKGVAGLFSCIELAGAYLLVRTCAIGGAKSLPNRVCYVLMKSRRLRKDLYLAETVLHRPWRVDLNPQKVGGHLHRVVVPTHFTLSYSALASFRHGNGKSTLALLAEG